jgi:hypothetical protein
VIPDREKDIHTDLTEGADARRGQAQNLQRRLGALEQECAAREAEAEKQRREFEATASAREWQPQALQERLKVRGPSNLARLDFLSIRHKLHSLQAPR